MDAPWCILAGPTAIAIRRNAQTQFRARPEARLGSATPNVPPFVDTGIIAADHWQLSAWRRLGWLAPSRMQAEQIFAGVSQPSGDRGLRGWYVTTSYFLTGEHRRYRRDLGVFNRVRPPPKSWRPAMVMAPRGPGRWEVAFRVSHIDLDDSPIQGGGLTDLTCGVNWYLNPYLRVQQTVLHCWTGPRATRLLTSSRTCGLRLLTSFTVELADLCRATGCVMPRTGAESHPGSRPWPRCSGWSQDNVRAANAGRNGDEVIQDGGFVEVDRVRLLHARAVTPPRI